MLAIVQRGKRLKDFAVKHLAYSHHAEAVGRQYFADQLVPRACPSGGQLTEDEIQSRLQGINAHFNSLRPPRLRIRIMDGQGNSLLDSGRLDPGQGFNVLVFVSRELIYRQMGIWQTAFCDTDIALKRLCHDCTSDRLEGGPSGRLS
ncbi:hypothetical protein [Rhizobium gallicum]|uniref:hypothetical protein n=1 Tax=Rhizobium gallicum TaxID=56730 RepID=UPI0006933043|nr:hypothetical protein [Rhizobium gallicum]